MKNLRANSSLISGSVPVLFMLILLGTPAGPLVAGSIIGWNAASGLTPDQIDTPWTLTLTNGAIAPVLDMGVLRIETDANEKNAFYLQTEPVIDTDRPFTIEFRMRVISGSTVNSARGPVIVFTTVQPSLGTLLILDVDKVFFNVGLNTAGPIATVDTDDQHHDYRLEYDGAGMFVLFYDGDELLSAAAYSSASDHASTLRIGWGEGSVAALGVSEWISFGHTAAASILKDGFEIQSSD